MKTKMNNLWLWQKIERWNDVGADLLRQMPPEIAEAEQKLSQEMLDVIVEQDIEIVKLEKENARLRDAVVKNDKLRDAVRKHFGAIGDGLTPPEKRILNLSNKY